MRDAWAFIVKMFSTFTRVLIESRDNSISYCILHVLYMVDRVFST